MLKEKISGVLLFYCCLETVQMSRMPSLVGVGVGGGGICGRQCEF